MQWSKFPFSHNHQSSYYYYSLRASYLSVMNLTGRAYFSHACFSMLESARCYAGVYHIDYLQHPKQGGM